MIKSYDGLKHFAEKFLEDVSFFMENRRNSPKAVSQYQTLSR